MFAINYLAGEYSFSGQRTQSWGQGANETLWGMDWITSHAAAQKTANKPVLMEEFGVTSNQTTTYQLWWNTVVSSGLTGKEMLMLMSSYSQMMIHT